MRRLGHGNISWIIVLLSGASLIAGAVSWAQHKGENTYPEARNSHDLSTVFRTVAAEALPSVVSIEAKTSVTSTRSGSSGVPFNDPNSPFREFFEQDPRFRQFFRELPQQQLPPRIGMGSGFVIDKSGIILTNSHVVRDASEVTVQLQDGREFIATDVKTDPRSDVAIVRIKAPVDLKAIRLGDSDAMHIGDWVMAVGSPFRLDFSVTAGIISAKGRGPGIADREDFIQTDAAINPGNSGGPLLNLNGEVIGINTAISTRSGGSQGVGFAIPVNMAKWVSQQLTKAGKVQRAYIGVGVQPVDSDYSKRFKTAVGHGAIIKKVYSDSPAAEAGLQPGDIILQLNGKEIKGPITLQSTAEKLPFNKKYTMVILRDGHRVDVPITLRALPEEYTTASLNGPRGPAPSEGDTFDEIGLEVQELTSEIAEKLGLENAEGVVISSVALGGPASMAGLKTGDVIEKVGARAIASPTEFREAIQDASLKDGVLLFVRDRQGTHFVEIKVDR
jgi:serine protease Do